MEIKINTIRSMIEKYRPKCVAVQEVNFTEEQAINDIQIKGYKLELDKQLAKHGRARAALYIHETLKHTRRFDLETDCETHVWITIHYNGGRKLNLQCLYRQWQSMGPQNAIPNTNTPQHQLQRFNLMAEQW